MPNTSANTFEPWFECHACKRSRPDHIVGVRSLDTSERMGLAPGSIRQNFRFCMDTPACIAKAVAFDGFDVFDALRVPY